MRTADDLILIQTHSHLKLNLTNRIHRQPMIGKGVGANLVGMSSSCSDAPIPKFINMNLEGSPNYQNSCRDSLNIKAQK